MDYGCELPPGVVRVRADNPSPLTLEGTNTYIVDRWVVDPGPDDSRHVEAVLAAAPQEIEGIVFTHLHADHTGAAAELGRRAGGVQAFLAVEGQPAGPFEALHTPGHTPDHVCLVCGDVCFTGDTVLGSGSVFIAPGEGSLAAYIASLRRLRALEPAVLCPGHGPIVWDPRGKLDEYISHRLEREDRLVHALAAGLRTPEELLDAAWSDAPPQLRPAARLTLAAHLEKLKDEGRLPADMGDLDLHFD